MSSPTRESIAWKGTPTLGNIVAKIYQSIEHLKTLSKNEIEFPANSYDDVNKHSFIPSDLFWDEASLYYSSRQFSQPGYVKEFLTFDERAPLRGSFKRTEVGMMFAEELSEADLVKPGDAMTTPKQFYKPVYQDKSRPLEDIHLRALIDEHLFDFSQHFNTHEEYFRIIDQMFQAMNQSIEIVETLLVDAFILALFGGHLHCYPIGSPLYRFFADPSGWVPDEGFSKMAKKFYEQNGEIAKTVKEIANWTTKTYTSKSVYLTNVIKSEIPSKEQNLEIPKFSKDLLPDFSTREKVIETARDWYLQKEPNADQWKKVNPLLRRQCLMAFVDTLSRTIRRLTRPDIRNHAAYEHYGDNTNKVLYHLASDPKRLLVFMNEGDYVDLSSGLIGSAAGGMFTEIQNGKFVDLMRKGVTFYGLPFVLPGCVAIIDRLAFSLKEYYHGDFVEWRPYHLVTSRIKHVKKKPVMYEHVVFETLCPARGQKFTPDAGWASENFPLLVKDA